jgi:dihydrodipicolinate reductase
MKIINICVSGALGKMGKILIKKISTNKNLKLIMDLKKLQMELKLKVIA